MPTGAVTGLIPNEVNVDPRVRGQVIAQNQANAANQQAATDAALITAAAQKHTSWQPQQTNVVQSQPSAPIGNQGPVNPQQPTPPPAQPPSSLASIMPSQQSPYPAQGPVKPTAPLPANPLKAYAPLTPATGPAILNDPALQAVAGAHNNADTSMAVGSSPTFNPVQSYTAKGPNGQMGQFSLDRAGIISDLMGQGRGDLANGLVKQWTDADLQSEQTKQVALIKQHALLAGNVAAFESLPESMKPAAYSALMAQVKSEGVNTAGILPDAYDPKDAAGIAQIKNFEAQASTVAEKEKAKMDQVVATMDQQRTAETARHDKADEWLKGQENKIAASKAAQAVNGVLGSAGLVGPAFLAQLDPATINTLQGIATGKLVLPPRGQQTSALLQAAHQAWPDVDIPGAQKLTKDLGASNAGTSGGIAEGSNKTLEHIGVMMAQDQAGGQRGSTITPNFLAAGANAVINALEPDENNAKAAWNQAHAATLTEMSRSFKGGPPGESEVVRDMKTLSFNDPPAKKQAVYRAFADLLQGQTGAVESQRKSVYGSLDPGTSLLTSQAQKVYAALHGGSTGNLLPAFDSQQSVSSAPPAASGTNHPAAAQMKDGTVSQSGKFVWHGGWVPR
jgi:hypothetical protein